MPDILCREARKDQQWRSYFTVMEAYSSMDELVDKCAYYLAHDEEQKQIAKNGYEKVSASHIYPHRIRKMLKTLIPMSLDILHFNILCKMQSILYIVFRHAHQKDIWQNAQMS